MDKLYYTWDQYFHDVKWLSDEIKQDGHTFSCVVGIARGGVIPGVQLSYMLGLPFIPKVWQTRDGSHQDMTILPANCLIVDDMNDSGTTLKQVTQLCSGGYRTCTLFNNDASTFNVDYFARPNDNKWVVFPWEKINE